MLSFPMQIKCVSSSVIFSFYSCVSYVRLIPHICYVGRHVSDILFVTIYFWCETVAKYAPKHEDSPI